MTVHELMQELFSLSNDLRDYSDTCDTCKAGDPHREIRKVAVTMFPTVQVIKDAAAWGADLLLVHEPTYFNHLDHHSDEKIEKEKRALIEEAGMTIFRYHDHPHGMDRDMIAEGEFEALALEGKYTWDPDNFDLVKVELGEPMTPRALAARIEQKLNIRHVRICGAADVPCTRIVSLFGAPGGEVIYNALKAPENEIVMTGEATEWSVGEYARDAAQLGYAKALLILGHVGSERDGMSYLARLIQKKYPQLETRYFDCGEVYTYTDEK